MKATFSHASADAPASVLVIAEIGVNHDGSVDKALSLINSASAAGADAVKFQYFHADRLLSAEAVLANYQRGERDPRSMLRRLELGLDELLDCREEAEVEGLGFIVTPFSVEDARELAELKVDAVKIASPDAVNLPLLEAAAELGRPMFISTGTCHPEELEPAAGLLRGHAPGGCLMQCVSCYPTPDPKAALGGVAALRERFELPVGYSDHTAEVVTGALAVAAGACVLEKHFTYNRGATGPDHAASLDGVLFTHYVDLARKAAQMVGPLRKSVLDVEADVHKVSRQSLCAARDLPVGHPLAPGDLVIKRPGLGIPAARMSEVMGRRLARAVPADHLIRESDLA